MATLMPVLASAESGLHFAEEHVGLDRLDGGAQSQAAERAKC
jgi:hypothetical protein